MVLINLGYSGLSIKVYRIILVIRVELVRMRSITSNLMSHVSSVVLVEVRDGSTALVIDGL